MYFFFLVHFTRSSLNIARENIELMYFFFYGASCHTLNWYYYSILLFTRYNWDWGGCWLMNTRTVYLNFGSLIAIIKQIWASLNDNVITDFLSEKLYQNKLFLMKWICIRTMVLTAIYSATLFIKFWLSLFLLNRLWTCKYGDVHSNESKSLRRLSRFRKLRNNQWTISAKFPST